MRNFLGKRVHSRQERSSLGLCTLCEEPAVSKRKLCMKHLDSYAKRAIIRRKERIAKGLCGSCGGELTSGRICNKCKKYSKELHNERIKKGLCTRCANPASNGFKTCENCRKEYLKWQHENSPRRYRRFFMNALNQVRSTRGGRRKGGGNATALDLVLLWKHQRGICALTGAKLTRENAEVDHVLPQSRGGSNNIDNLQWTIKDVNRAKQGLTDQEFFDLCKQVVEHSEKRIQ